MQSGRDERQPHLPYVARFLSQGIRDDGQQTSFKNILSFPPAHNATLKLATGEMRMWRYWDIHPERSNRQLVADDAIEMLSGLLRSSIQLHMRSDVAVGTCLSGGLDSSAIVALMSEIRSDPVHTFSALYQDKNCNESDYVDAVNRSCQCRPCSVRPQPNGDLIEDLSRITWHQDEPTAAPGVYTQYYVMRRARERVKVVLDGQGGDELFAGYLHYFKSRIQDLVSKRPVQGRWAAWKLLLSISRHWGLMAAARAHGDPFGGAIKKACRSPRKTRLGKIDTPAVADAGPRHRLEYRAGTEVFHRTGSTALHTTRRHFDSKPVAV